MTKHLNDPRVIGVGLGALLGLIFVGAEIALGLFYLPGFSLAEQHALHPALYLIDLAPEVLGLAGFFLGDFFTRAYSAARRSEAIFDAINTAPVSFMLCEGEAPYSVLHVNQEFENLTGYTVKEAVGRPCDYLQGDAGDENAEALARLNRAIGRGQGVTVTLKNFRKDGQPFWVELKVFPLKARDGSWSMLAGLQTDVSRERRMVRHAEAYNHELQRWRHVFLSRENRNISLKSEVDQLRSRLGLAPKYAGRPSDQVTIKAGEV